MAGNSKPLRWDDVGATSPTALVAYGFQAGAERVARTNMATSLGEVDDRFIHVSLFPDGSGDGAFIVKRSETDGCTAS